MVNERSYTPENLDRVRFDYFHLVKMGVKYRDPSGYMPFKYWLKYPVTGIFTCRGCNHNCGACGATCPSGEACVAGACSSTCAAGQAFCYSNADLRKGEEPEEIFRFIAFWERTHGAPPRHLVFDSRLTTYANLARLDEMALTFLTLRRVPPRAGEGTDGAR